MKLTKKRNVWDPMNVFLLTLLTSVNVWRRQTLPEIVSSKVPEITFRHCVTKILTETKILRPEFPISIQRLSFSDAKFLIAMLTFFLQFLDFWYWNKDTSNLPNYSIPTLTLSFQDQVFCHWWLTLRLFSKAIFKPILKPSKIGKSFNIERYKKPRCHTLLSGLGSERCWWRKSWRRWSSAASWAAGCWGAHWGQGPGLSIWWGPPSRWNRRRKCWSRSPPPHSSRGQAIDTCSGKKSDFKKYYKMFFGQSPARY